MTREERQWISDWMQRQEAINREVALEIQKTADAVINLMIFTGMIDNSPLTDEEEAWARRIAEEGR